MDEITSLGIKVGNLEGRLSSMETRLDRHENTVGTALKDFGGAVERLSVKMESGQKDIKDKIDKIESSLDREEGARAQIMRDTQAADKLKDDADQQFWNKENLRILKWSVALGFVGSILGAIIETHTHFLP